MGEYAMTIDGHAVEGVKFFPVINPATGSPFAEAPECTPQQLADAIEAAHCAFGSWRHDEARRRQALRACGSTIRNHVDLLANTLTREQGKPLQRAVEEVKETASYFEETACRPIPCDTLRDDA